MRNEIPILEFDDDPAAVVSPRHEHLGLWLPERAVFPFLGAEVDRFAEKHGARLVTHFVSATKEYPVYVARIGGHTLCLVQAPVGAPAATQILDWLVGYGVRKVISAGSCGVLTTLDENVFLVPARALRDEGTSYHYLAPSRFVDVSPVARQAIEETLAAHGLPVRTVTTWSCDGFYRETKAKVSYRRSEGCEVVEMECSALASCATMRGICWGELLYTADTLASAAAYDERGWGKESASLAMKLCVEAALRL